MPLSRASTGAFETSASTRAGSYRSRTRDGSSKSGASTTTRSARTAHSAARHRPSTRRPHQPQKRRPPDMHISPISTARRLLGFQPGVSKPTQARVGGKVKNARLKGRYQNASVAPRKRQDDSGSLCAAAPRQFPSRPYTPAIPIAPLQSVSLEVLNFPLVLLRRLARLERAQVARFPGLRVLLSRVQPIPAVLELSDHPRFLHALRTATPRGGRSGI